MKFLGQIDRRIHVRIYILVVIDSMMYDVWK